MSVGKLIRPPARTGAEKIREFEQRLRELETKQTVRAGEWVLHSEDGRLLATKPGAVNDVGTPVAEQVDLGATRGYVTESEVAQAVSGGKTSSLPSATVNQVDKDLATENAQYTADNANATAARIEAQLSTPANGVFLPDSFDRPVEDEGFGAAYFMTRSSGPMKYRVDGEGTTSSSPNAGANIQTWTFRNVTHLNTVKQLVSATLDGGFRSGQSSAGNNRLNLCARISDDNASRIEAIVEKGRAIIGYTLPGGSFVDMSGWQGFKAQDGDRFDFWCGLSNTGDDRFKFALLRNNLTVATANDLGQNTAPLLANLSGAVGVRTAVIVSGYITYQVAAPRLQAINIADRT